EKFKKFERRFEKHQLLNLLPIHANAISWVTTHLNEECLDRIFLLYPNPNPKDRAKRWICMPFMKQLLSCLKKNGQLIFASNEIFYIEEVMEYALHFWKLELVKNERVELARTHFEKKYLQRGETCTEIILKKNY
ncbi:MAG: SAM-dependent methyltransferase, partial [Bdellovibrio sp. CG_4_9_14_3_um_filter_39_7]